MNVLFNVGHPAQVHLFKHALWTLQRRGHRTLVTSREKDVTVDLLDAYEIDHEVLTTGEGLGSLPVELLTRERRLLSTARAFEPDVLVSRLDSAAPHVARIVGARSVAVEDTWVRSKLLRGALFRLVLPFVDVICAPTGFDLPVPPDRRKPLDFQELAYLHPSYFEPNPAGLEAAGVRPDERYAVVRLAGWTAYHDVGHRGLSPAGTVALVAALNRHGTVYVSSEGPLPGPLEPYRLRVPPERIHDVLYHAALLVGDSGTMSSEAAILGTPAIRTNSLVGDEDEPIFIALEEEYGLLSSFVDEQRAISAAVGAFARSGDREAARRQRARLVSDTGDVTEALVEVILESAEDDPSADRTAPSRAFEAGERLTGTTDRRARSSRSDVEVQSRDR